MSKSETSLSGQINRIYGKLYESFGPQHWWPGDSALEIMIGAILTQSTNWQNVTYAIDNIKRAKLLDARKLLLNRKNIPELIRPSGYYKIKSKRLCSFLEYFVNEYECDCSMMLKKRTKTLRRELLKVSGIGLETADSILLYALDRPVFVVDAYTRRVFSRHQFFNYHLPYDRIRSIFEDALPRSAKHYNEYHALIVKLGKTFCQRNEPSCHSCPVRDIQHTA